MKDRELSSWTEIATHLGVSVRTAQMWEKECGMPVRRLPGRNHVLASVEELEEWKRSGRRSGVEPEEDPKEERKPWNWRWWAVAAAVLAAGLAVAGLRGRGASPYAVRVEPLGLTVLDEEGRTLWRKPFAREVVTSGTCGLVKGVVADLDGDGRKEVLFSETQEGGAGLAAPVVCWNADGTERWRFTPGRAVATAKTSYSPEYRACTATVLPEAMGGARLAVGSLHWMYSPYQVAFLTAEGRVVREYWHAGHLQHTGLQDIDGDGRPELLLAGVNNVRGRATLVALDPGRTQGVAAEERREYQLAGMAVAREKARIFFPRSGLEVEHGFNFAYRMDLGADGVTVHVGEEEVPNYAPVYYHLNRDLSLRSAVLSDVFAARARRAGLDVKEEERRLGRIEN